MAYDDLELKLETAFQELISADETVQSLGLAVLTGLSDDDMTYPCVVCHCLGGPEIPVNSGNHDMGFEVLVMTKLVDGDNTQPAPQRRAAHQANVRAVRSIMAQSDLAARLSAQVEDFTAQHVLQNEASQTTDGVTAISTVRLTVYCCGVDIP